MYTLIILKHMLEIIMTHLIWFRNDLRIHDNAALYYACLNVNVNVIGVFIATCKQWEKHHISPKQIRFIYMNLIELKKNFLI